MEVTKCLIQIFVSDLDKAITWYVEKLGMKLVSRSDDWKSATLSIGGVNYDICQPIPKWGSNWLKAKNKIGGLKGIFFYIKDINQSFIEMKSKGVKFLHPPFKTPWGECKAHFVDLDKNEFSLVQEG
jgi:catechol 2,3-dioxygenase-like lactoylglutathione lyase family enzyme